MLSEHTDVLPDELLRLVVELALVSLLLLLRPQLESVSSASPCKTDTREDKDALPPDWL